MSFPTPSLPLRAGRCFGGKTGFSILPPTLWRGNRGEAVCAQCLIETWKTEWVMSSSPPPGNEEQTSSIMVMSMGGVVLENPPPPKILLPAGKYWKLEAKQIKHEAPEHSCACGIYIGKDPLTANGYGTILAKVRGWGRTVEHGQGWRVEYAYPSELIATSMEQALELAEYGVPVTLAEDIEDPVVAGIVWNAQQPQTAQAQTLRILLVLAPVFLAALTIAQSVNVIFNPSIVGTIAFGIVAAATGFLARASLEVWE